MADISFKKFVTFLEIEGEPTEAQLDEIFGFFQNNAKAEKAKKEREALLAKKRELSKQKDAIFAKKKAEIEAGGGNPQERGSGTMRSHAASGRAAEREWIAQLANESEDKAKEFLKHVNSKGGPDWDEDDRSRWELVKAYFAKKGVQMTDKEARAVATQVDALCC